MTTSFQKATDSLKDSSPPGVAEITRRARTASRSLAKLSHESRNEVLMAVAKAIEDDGRRILEAHPHP